MFTGCLSPKKPLEIYVVDIAKENTFKYLAEKFSSENKGRYKINVVCINASKVYLLNRIINDKVPDVIAMDGNSIYTELVKGDYLLELKKEEYSKYINNNFLHMVDSISGDKKGLLYGFPYAVNASGLIYNETIFEENGLTPPKTWTEFINVCDKLKSVGVTPILMNYIDEWTTLPPWNNIVPVLIPDTFINEKNNGVATFSQTHREVLGKYAEILNCTQGSEAFSTGFFESLNNFALGKGAMIINGNWSIPIIKQSNKDIRINSIPFPSCDIEEKNTVNSGIDIMITIAKDSKNQKLAKKFLKFLLKTENAQEYVNRQYGFSTVNGVKQEDPSVRGLIEALRNNRISDFPDHYYPSDFMLEKILLSFAQNKERSIPDEQNISATLLKCDKEYDECIKIGLR